MFSLGPFSNGADKASVLIFGRRHDGRWRGGRPRVDAEVRELIGHMAWANLLWGAPRIHGELLKLGFTLCEATVSRYLRRLPRPRSQGWATFVRNHLLLIPDRFDSVAKHRHHLGGGHLDRTAAFPASEWRSPERGGPMRPVFSATRGQDARCQYHRTEGPSPRTQSELGVMPALATDRGRSSISGRNCSHSCPTTAGASSFKRCLNITGADRRSPLLYPAPRGLGQRNSIGQ